MDEPQQPRGLVQVDVSSMGSVLHSVAFGRYWNQGCRGIRLGAQAHGISFELGELFWIRLHTQTSNVPEYPSGKIVYGQLPSPRPGGFGQFDGQPSV